MASPVEHERTKMKKTRIIIRVPEGDDILLAMNEAAKATVGRNTAFRHPPHFVGGEVHGHCDLPGSHQVSWTITGSRLHPGKFPADDKIPKDAKAAVAAVLGVKAELLEAYMAYDEMEKSDVFVVERKLSRAAQLLQLLKETK